MKYLLFLLSIGLFSGQAAIARPWLYTSIIYSIDTSEPVGRCMWRAEDALEDAGFTRNLKTTNHSSRVIGVKGYLKNHPVVAEVECHQSARAFLILTVSGNDSKLTYEKYSSLFESF